MNDRSIPPAAVSCRCLAGGVNRRAFLGGLALGTAAVATRHAVGHASEDTTGANLREVDFIDERWVEHTYFLTRKVNQPERFLDGPVIGPSPAAANGTVLPTDHGLVMWYLAPYRREGNEGPLYETCVHYAVSADGCTFEKPALGLREFDQSDEKNIILMTNEVDAKGRPFNGAGGCSGFCVLDANLHRVPHARGRYTVMYRTSAPKVGGGLYLAHSDDGLHWNAYPENPIRFGGDTYNNFLYDERIGRYVAYVRPRIHAGPPRVNRLMSRIESQDMIHWANEQVVLDTDDRDAPAQGRIRPENDTLGYPRGRDVQFYGLTATRHQDIYLGFAPVYDSASGLMSCELVHSDDGITWQREPRREAFIPLGPEDSWDCGMIGFVSAGCPVTIGDYWYVYYTGMNWDHHFNIRGTGKKERVRLVGAVRLKRGRLIGYHTGPVEGAGQERGSGRQVPLDWRNKGELLTRPFKLDGSRLFVNVDAKSGSAAVEICGIDGVPFPGFSRDDAIPVQQDSLRSEARFRGAMSIGQIRGKEVRLRIHLEKASVFGVGFGS